jgi:hypothetical protein
LIFGSAQPATLQCKIFESMRANGGLDRVVNSLLQALLPIRMAWCCASPLESIAEAANLCSFVYCAVLGRHQDGAFELEVRMRTPAVGRFSGEQKEADAAAQEGGQAQNYRPPPWLS